MAGRWRDPAAFRADPAVTPAARPSRRQATALLAVLVLIAGAVAVASYVVRPDRARTFDLFHGSMFLTNVPDPVAVDLATGKPTVRLSGAAAQVGAKNAVDLSVVPLEDESLLLNKVTGEFNIVDTTGFVVKRTGGVPLPERADSASVGIASGSLAYIEQTGPTGTSVYRVDKVTVQSAVSTKNVKPRASLSMPQPASTAPGAAASDSNGDLWLLLGSGDQRTIRRLSVPADSNPGATLTSSDRGTVKGAAAVESAATSTGAAAVAVASSDRIQLFGPTKRTIRFPAQAGVDAVLPTSNADGRLSFLLHGTKGWSSVSIDTDGGSRRGPSLLSGVPAGAQLVAPAESRGSLYTMDGVTGQLIRIDAAGRTHAIKGATMYPRASVDGHIIEPGGFTDAYAVADGARVIFNSPSHLDALALFTDGSHAPLRIQKGDAVAVSASGGAEALTKNPAGAQGTGKGDQPKNGGAKPKPVAGQGVNTQIECKNTTQKPHIPRIGQATPGSRSVLLNWTYPIVGQQDCQPSTYQVKVKLLSNSAPSPPGTVTVGNQQSVNLTGLFPSSQYEITVVAYIGGQGTPSQPIRVTTGPEGPAAPTNLAVGAGSSGNWTVTWASCGTAAQGCIPASTWKVIPRFCDGRGLGNPPDPITVSADPTSREQQPATLNGGDALLGRGLSFQVEGIGEQGTVGTPSKTSQCVYSWSAPVGSDIRLTASTPPSTSSASATTTTTASVTFAENAIHDLGGVGGTLTYKLLSSGGLVIDTVGPTTATKATLHGIKPGQKYQVSATATPPRHPAAAVTVGPVNVNQAVANWPTISVSVAQGDVHNDGAFNADVTMQIGGVTSANANGEKFDVGFVLTCGNTATDVMNRAGIDPADPITFPVSRLTYAGTCTVTVKNLNESGSAGVYGGTPAPNDPTSAAFSIDQPTLTGVSASDFNASWDGSSGGQSQVHIAYTGGNPVLGLLASWTVAVTDPDGTACGGYSSVGTLNDVTVAQSCVDKNGKSGSGWKVVVSVSSIASQSQGPFTISGIDGGAAPTYNPPVCNVSAANLSAVWSGSAAAPSITIGAGDAGQVADCTGWKYQIVGPTTNDCGDQTNGAPSTTPTIATTCSDPPATPGWSVTVTYTDTDGSAKSVPVNVTGDPPS